jgi:hypothetical protein
MILYCRSKYTRKNQHRCVSWKSGKDWVENSCIVDLYPRPTAMALEMRKQLKSGTRVIWELSVTVVSVVSKFGLNLVWRLCFRMRAKRSKDKKVIFLNHIKTLLYYTTQRNIPQAKVQRVPRELVYVFEVFGQCLCRHILCGVMSLQTIVLWNARTDADIHSSRPCHRQNPGWDALFAQERGPVLRKFFLEII